MPSIADQQAGTIALDQQLWKQAVLTINDHLYRRMPESLHTRISAATALALDPGKVKTQDGTWYVAAGKSGWYEVNGSCTCKDFTMGSAPEGWCKHRLAANIVKSALALDPQEYVPLEPARLEPLPPGDTTRPEAGTPPEPETPPTRRAIPARFIQKLQGKDFVRFAGLLAMAQDDGLVELAATWTHNEPELSLAHAVAIFADGRRFEESGDSTPQNARNIGLHWRRMALTRAKARALRDALGIEECSVEELE